MAMFSHRALQRAINERLLYADRSKRSEWAKVLNSPTSPRYIPTEWELLILKSLATLGTLHTSPNSAARPSQTSDSSRPPSTSSQMSRPSLTVAYMTGTQFDL